MNNKKKKKIYSKVKTPILEVNKIPQNPMQFVTEFYQRDNVWSKFIDEVVYRNRKIRLSNYQNIKHLFSYVKNKQIKRDILNILMKNPNYNPYLSNLPLETFPDNYKNFLIKLQNKVKQREQQAKSINKQKRFMLFNNKIYSMCLIRECKEKITRELFAEGYDILFICNDQKYIITSNPKLENRPDFTDLFERFNSYEPHTWYLHGNKGILMVKNGSYSKLFFKQVILEFLK